jgi:putative SOS response-associated peptidase YedK
VEAGRSSISGTTELVAGGSSPLVEETSETINPSARADGVADRPMLGDAFKRQRCVVPASRYYEWQKWPGSKQPYFIREAGRRGVLRCAGLWPLP